MYWMTAIPSELIRQMWHVAALPLLSEVWLLRRGGWRGDFEGVILKGWLLRSHLPTRSCVPKVFSHGQGSGLWISCHIQTFASLVISRLQKTVSFGPDSMGKQKPKQKASRALKPHRSLLDSESGEATVGQRCSNIILNMHMFFPLGIKCYNDSATNTLMQTLPEGAPFQDEPDEPIERAPKRSHLFALGSFVQRKIHEVRE